MQIKIQMISRAGISQDAEDPEEEKKEEDLFTQSSEKITPEDILSIPTIVGTLKVDCAIDNGQEMALLIDDGDNGSTGDSGEFKNAKDIEHQDSHDNI